jgi:hypothetical protein
MNVPPGPLSSKDVNRTYQELRAERMPARKRDRLMPRVRAARRRFAQAPSSALAKLR